MKFFARAAVLLLASFTLGHASPPTMLDDVSKALGKASKENKMAFILMGREACGNCQATKKLIKEEQVPVTEDTFVAADINVDDPRSSAEFNRKFKKEKFGSTLPFVVIADSKGKALASYSGFKSSADLKKLIEDAKSKATAAAPKK